MQETGSVERALDALGPFCVFPLVQCVFYLTTYLGDAHQLFAYVFTGQEVNHRCAPPGEGMTVTSGFSEAWSNSTVVTYERCVISIITNVSGDVRKEELSCVYGVEYDAPRDTSIVSEFDLVCGRKALAGLTQTLQSLGSLLGAIVCPWLSDVYGRKRLLVILQCLSVGSSVMSALAPSYGVYTAARVFTGFLIVGVGSVAVTASVEVLPAVYRSRIVAVGGCVWWSFCLASVSLIAFGLRHQSWRTLQLVLSASSGIFILSILVLKEPIHWLVAKGRRKEAETLLKRAARWSRLDPQAILNAFYGVDADPDPSCTALTPETLPLNAPSSSDTRFLNRPHNNAAELESCGLNVPHCKTQSCGLNEPHSETQSGGKGPLNGATTSSKEEAVCESRDDGHFARLFCHGRMRKNIVICMFLWFVNGLTYDALFLMSGVLALEIYWGFLLNAVVESAAAIMLFFTLTRIGRKRSIGLFHAIAGLGLIASGICFQFTEYHELQIAGTVLSLGGKMAISGSFNTLFLYTPEIFPTSLRSRALGTSVAAYMLGSMMAPFSSLLLDQAVWAPAVTIGTCCLLAMLLLLVLPESLGRGLPQDIRELERWYDVTSSTDQEASSLTTAATRT